MAAEEDDEDIWDSWEDVADSGVGCQYATSFFMTILWHNASLSCSQVAAEL